MADKPSLPEGAVRPAKNQLPTYPKAFIAAARLSRRWSVCMRRRRLRRDFRWSSGDAVIMSRVAAAGSD